MSSPTPIQFEPRSDGLTITVPPAGLRGGAMPMFLFSILWLSIITFICGIAALSLWWGTGASRGSPWILAALLPVFYGIGVGFLIGSLNTARRRAILDVTATHLLITQQSIFGVKQFDWPADQIQRIHVGPSGVVVNGRPIPCLLVTPAAGRPAKFFSGRTESDLHTLARALTDSLKLPPPPDPATPYSNPYLPPV